MYAVPELRHETVELGGSEVLVHASNRTHVPVVICGKTDHHLLCFVNLGLPGCDLGLVNLPSVGRNLGSNVQWGEIESINPATLSHTGFLAILDQMP